MGTKQAQGQCNNNALHFEPRIYSNALEDKFKFENNIFFMSEAANPSYMDWNNPGYIFSTSYSGQTDTEVTPSKILSRIISKNNCIVNERGDDIGFFKQFIVDGSGQVQSVIGHDHSVAVSDFGIDGSGDVFPTDMDFSSYFTDADNDDFSQIESTPCLQANIGLTNSEIIKSLASNEISSIEANSDVNQDSVINVTDAMLTLRNSLGLDMAGTTWRTSAITGDANCDGSPNTSDALLILRYSLGLDMGETEWCN